MKKNCMKMFVTAVTLGMVMAAAAPATVEAAGVKPAVSGSSQITKGKNVQFSVKYKKKRVSAKSCKWYSTKKSVATVSRTGKVTGKKAGTTYIYVKYKGRTSAKKKITVKNPAVKPAVSGSGSITRGKSAQFSVKYSGKKVSAESCEWYTTKKSVATVSKTGKVTGKKAGTAYIYVKYKGKTSAKRKVVVKNPAPAKPSSPSTKPSAPSESKPEACTKESDHNWERQPGGEHRYYETIVKKATTFCVCRLCGFVNEKGMPSPHGSWTVSKVGPEIYRDDCDHTEPYKCSKCGKTKVEKWTERGEETLRVYSPRENSMVKYDPGACQSVICPNCKVSWRPPAWEKWNGVCFNCNRAYPEWRDNILYPWDYGDVYRDWDKNGKEMAYNPDSKTWEYTGR